MASDSDSEDNAAEATENPEEQAKSATFEALGVCNELCEACVELKWKQPTEIQAASIPHLIKGAPAPS